MKRNPSVFRFLAGGFLAVLLAGAVAPQARARILDDFNDNAKTGWTDFTFVPGFGLPGEVGGQFRFELPAAGQDIFSASQKVSEAFELKEGRTIEFRVDLVGGSGPDAFAVLAFIPNTGGNNPGTLGGYGLAKDPDDVLITKGVQKYFVADDGATAELKNENVTLSLTLAVKGGAVTVTGRILDKDANNAVLWERTVTDTAAADPMEDGTDSPAAPYITTGYFTLYCYQQFNAAIGSYEVQYDNAEVYVLDETVLDDFNDNTKTGWTDFTFVPGFGLPTEAGGEFRFELPAAGQDIFSASQKTTRQFELKEGDRYEFRVDVVDGSGPDAFAVLAFIPNTGGNNPGTLGGYGLAKDPDDVLITKGVQKYFVADDGATAELKQNNITLSLTLTVKGGAVTVTGRILDKDANNAVLWERTVTDTAAADPMEDGTDSPAAPYITTGYFTLYCYQQFNAAIGSYEIRYDNAVVVAPPAEANIAPIISDVAPADYATFLPVSTQVSFKASDDKDLPNDKLSVVLNDQTFTTANGLTVTGSGGTKTATLGGLKANTNYKAVLQAEDAEGLKTSRTLYFDTFATGSLIVDAEDYNFDGGSYFNNPVRSAEGLGQADNSYVDRMGVEGIDFHDTRTAPSGNDTPYRTSDPVRMARSRDQRRAAFDPDNLVYDYDVGDLATGEWIQFTRQFPAGNYQIYLRQALANMATGESVLELVTGDRTQPEAATQVLGSFLGERTGFQYRNFALTDATGQNPIVLRLSGVTTLRLRQITPDPGDGARLQNYFVFIPAADPGKQLATVSTVSPANGADVREVAPAITAEIQNRDTSVKVPTVVLAVNGAPVNATVAATAQGARVDFALNPLPPSGSTVACRLSFRDSEDTEITSEWSFLLTYTALDPANRRTGTGLDRGLAVRMVQAPAGSNLANTLTRAEEQLAANSPIPKAVETNTTAQVVNQNQAPTDEGGAGFFLPPAFPETMVPGLAESAEGTDDFSVEVTAWLELAAGPYRFGVVSDDGFKITSGADPKSTAGTVLGARSGGTANETFDFVVTASGFYPFRMIWYERGGGAHAEWFSVNLADGTRTLINDPQSASAIKAWQAVDAPPTAKLMVTRVPTGLSITSEPQPLAAGWVLQVGASVNGPWIDQVGANTPVTVPIDAAAPARFLRAIKR
jgi:hypothetical protein